MNWLKGDGLTSKQQAEFSMSNANAQASIQAVGLRGYFFISGPFLGYVSIMCATDGTLALRTAEFFKNRLLTQPCVRALELGYSRRRDRLKSILGA
jgi:hypothetical protein